MILLRVGRVNRSKDARPAPVRAGCRLIVITYIRCLKRPGFAASTLHRRAPVPGDQVSGRPGLEHLAGLPRPLGPLPQLGPREEVRHPPELLLLTPGLLADAPDAVQSLAQARYPHLYMLRRMDLRSSCYQYDIWRLNSGLVLGSISLIITLVWRVKGITTTQ